jgi:uncharacterized protein YdbL (DUF1318 family)
MRAMVKTINNASAPTTLVASALPPYLVIIASTDNVVALVRIVKSMREMGYESFLSDQDVEIAGKWIKKIEKTLI